MATRFLFNWQIDRATEALYLVSLGRVVNYCNSTRNASPDFEDG